MAYSTLLIWAGAMLLPLIVAGLLAVLERHEPREQLAPANGGTVRRGRRSKGGRRR
jgi:hypothetical protein